MPKVKERKKNELNDKIFICLGMSKIDMLICLFLRRNLFTQVVCVYVCVISNVCPIFVTARDVLRNEI